jgi:hypothetical protein
VPCNVGILPWQVRVSGAGYRERGRAIVDLADSGGYSNVQICIGDAVSDEGGCVPLSQAVRAGGAAVPNLPSLSQANLESAGLHVIIKGERDGEIQQLADFRRKLDVSPKNVCSGYTLSGSSEGYFAALFLVDASPE